MNFRHIPLATVALLACCGLGKPVPPWQDTLDNELGSPETSVDLNEPPTAPLLDIATIPQRTCAEKIAITGTGEPGATVVARGGRGNSAPITIQGTRKFCIPFELSPGQQNDIEVVAQNSAGWSAPSYVTVIHECAAHEGSANNGVSHQPAPAPSNVAIGAEVTTNYQPAEGTASAIVDGDISSYAVWHSSWHAPNPFCATNAPKALGWQWDGYAMITLSSLVKINQVTVHWRDKRGGAVEASYGWRYKILVSDSPGDPSEPNLIDGQWVEAITVSDGHGGREDFSLSSAILGKHVAIMMEMDGYCWTPSLTTFFQVSIWEYFAVSEVEISAEPPERPNIPQPTDVCLGAAGVPGAGV